MTYPCPPGAARFTCWRVRLIYKAMKRQLPVPFFSFGAFQVSRLPFIQAVTSMPSLSVQVLESVTGKAITFCSLAYFCSLAGAAKSMSLNLRPVSVVSTNTALQAASSSGTFGPPKGHPVPVLMSMAMPFFRPSSSEYFSASIHGADRNDNSFF